MRRGIDSKATVTAQHKKVSVQQRSRESPVRSSQERLYAAWSDLDPAKAAPLDKDPKLASVYELFQGRLGISC